jgi:hypothetical protein
MAGRPIKPRPRKPLPDVKQETVYTLPLLRTSERKDFKRCPQRWWWAWRDGLYQAGPPNDKLWFGTGWHIVMAHIYQPGLKRGKTPLKVWREWVGDEMTKIRVNVSGADDYKEEVYINAAQLGEEMIGNYLDTYGKDEHMYVLQTERPFEVVIVSPAGQRRVIFCGTYDGGYRDLRDDSVWVFENKTAKAIFTGHLTIDDQAGGYLMVASREMAAAGLIPKGKQVKGIMYNFARKAPKDLRPLNADGEATNKPTKEHYLLQMSDAGLIDLAQKWTLPLLQEEAERQGIVVVGERSANQPKPLFLRVESARTVRERNNMVGRIQAEVEHMNEMREGRLLPYKTPTRDCSWDCNFYQLCVMHERGGTEWEEYRDIKYKVRDPYEDHRKSADDGGED